MKCLFKSFILSENLLNNYRSYLYILETILLLYAYMANIFSHSVNSLLTYPSFLSTDFYFWIHFFFLRVHPLCSFVPRTQMMVIPFLLFLVIQFGSPTLRFPSTLASGFCFGPSDVYCLPVWHRRLIFVFIFSYFTIIQCVRKLLFKSLLRYAVFSKSEN